LAIGADDAYKLPGSFFKQISRGNGSGEILMRFAPQNGESAEGTVLQAELQGRYADAETDGVCLVWLLIDKDSMALRVSGEGGTVHTLLPAVGSVFVSAAIDFQFSEAGTIVSIGAGNMETGAIEQWESLNIDFIANGEGSVQFGGTFDPPGDTEEPADSYPGILTEVGLLYNEISPSTPPPPAVESENPENDEEILEDAEAIAETEISA
jgi:hypothetical protein